MSNEVVEEPNAEESKELIEIALEHYLKHHELVLKKLTIAQEATNASMEKLKEFSSSESPEEISEVWDDIINAFQYCGISQEELHSIEATLRNIPTPVKKHYEEIVNADETIAELIKSMDNEKYKNAMRQIEDVQSKPNPMSGLGPSEYDVKDGDVVNILDLKEADPEREWWDPDGD